ncbi:formate dehydrogenase subunit gamma [Thiobacillus sedimenti]|uniref:Formate dehydrogenase subunit gamma n=1 Tax=Thiobacillus sedimenti TaxID=3110231 RepID=A0ABZ1CLZ1_9PROT|nr:formate dehydrogenase subunit gamma [Thiobacillus sp. SCUT-2]WRS40408.1 formate dehydrogenase subunit gamma [Thiobacillus sp. SCUT-2]
MSTWIQRYTARERSNHWVVAITFVLAALSGLALFHPAFYFLTHLFGGGPWNRILHPFIGALMFLSFLGLAGRFWSLNRMTSADGQWMTRIKDVICNRDEGLPEIGKYNAGQKYLFWTMVVCVPLLLVSGIVIWRPWFAPYFPIGLMRVAVVVHALAAWILILGIVVHVYAAIWVKGTMRAMTRGTVSSAWARHHHRAWYREMTGK